MFSLRRNSNPRYLSLQEASLLTPYSANYIGLLVRKGKIPARKIKGRWFVSSKHIDHYLKNHSRVSRDEFSQARKSPALIFSLLAVTFFVGSSFFSLGVFGFLNTAKSGTAIKRDSPEVVVSDGAQMTVLNFSDEGSISSQSSATLSLHNKDAL